MEKNTVVSSYK